MFTCLLKKRTVIFFFHFKKAKVFKKNNHCLFIIQNIAGIIPVQTFLMAKLLLRFTKSIILFAVAIMLKIMHEMIFKLKKSMQKEEELRRKQQKEEEERRRAAAEERRRKVY